MMDEQIEITRGEFYRLLASAYDHGSKDYGWEAVKARLIVMRDMAPAGSEVSIALTKWIHEND